MEKNDEMQVDKLIECFKCGRFFKTSDQLVLHMKLVHDSCPTPTCDYSLTKMGTHSSFCRLKGHDCPVCHKVFSDQALMLAHFNQHIDVAYFVCDLCRKGFQLRKNLQKHILEVHSQSNGLIPTVPARSKGVFQKCTQCSQYYKLFQEFEQHKSVCNSLFNICDVCKTSCSSSAELQSHKRSEHKSALSVKGYNALMEGKRYFCGICYIGFTQGIVLKEHMLTHEVRVKYKCDVCQARFTSEEDLQEHYLLHIEEHYVMHDVIQQHSCSSCKSMFKSQTELEDHQSSEICSNLKSENAENIVCQMNDSGSQEEYILPDNNENFEAEMCETDAEICNADIDVPDTPVYILKAGDELLNCDDNNCVIVIDRRSVFVLQRGDCVEQERMPQMSNLEAYDENDNIDASLLKNHMLYILFPSNSGESSAHLSQNEMQSDSKTATQSIIADVSVANSISDDIPGNVNDTSNVPVAHDMLNELYAAVLRNQTEDAAVHSTTDLNIKDISPAPLSGENVFSVTSQQKRSRSSESDFEPVPCNVCQQVFGSIISLCLHMNGNHTGFDCYTCGVSFNSEFDLVKHENGTHPDSFMCEVCAKVFTSEIRLKKHKADAHSEKTIVCIYCERRCPTRKDYEIHMKIHKSGSNLKCNECSRSFGTLLGLKRHKEQVHEAIDQNKTFICNLCGSGFVAFLPLKKHIANHMKQTKQNYQCPKCNVYFSEQALLKHFLIHEKTS